MIVGIGAVDSASDLELFRPTKPMSASCISQHIDEFVRCAAEAEGLLECKACNYVYTSKGTLKIFAIATQEEPCAETLSALKHIADSSAPLYADIRLGSVLP